MLRTYNKLRHESLKVNSRCNRQSGSTDRTRSGSSFPAIDLAGTCRWFVCLIIVLGGWAPCQGQVERMELGKRLRRFEQSWQNAPEALRLKSTAAMQAAVTDFFSLKLQKAANNLDDAWFAVRGKDAPSDWELALVPFRMQVTPLLGDSSVAELQCRLVPFYTVEAKVADSAQVMLTIRRSGHQSPGPKHEAVWQRSVTWKELIADEGLKIDAVPFGSGDFVVEAQVVGEDRAHTLLSTMTSRVENLEERIAALESQFRQRDQFLIDTVRATLGDQLTRLQSLREGQIPESDVPAFQILSFCESLLAQQEQPQSLILESAQRQDLWLSLAQGRRRVPVRMRLPEVPAVPATGFPVLFLFHGAGGSENMFFETYGAGGAVQAGLTRGWLVVAPRQGFAGMSLDCRQMLDTLEQLLPIDRSQVFYLGHSMGAGQVVRQVGLDPKVPRAVAAIGGGNRPRNAAALASIPWFVAAGELDFGRNGAKGLAQALKQSGGEQIEYREFPNVEHMVIVQAALEATFEFFDQTLSDKSKR